MILAANLYIYIYVCVCVCVCVCVSVCVCVCVCVCAFSAVVEEFFTYTVFKYTLSATGSIPFLTRAYIYTLIFADTSAGY